MNEYLSGLMPGLTAKVFRTYNASYTLQQQLAELTDAKSDMPNLVLTYNRANRVVAVLCNHQVTTLHYKTKIQRIDNFIKMNKDELPNWKTF